MDAEDEANHIYTGDQEITIRRAWKKAGKTGADIIFTYDMINADRFAIYFTWNDGIKASIKVDSVEEREAEIKKG